MAGGPSHKQQANGVDRPVGVVVLIHSLAKCLGHPEIALGFPLANKSSQDGEVRPSLEEQECPLGIVDEVLACIVQDQLQGLRIFDPLMYLEEERLQVQ